MAPKKSALAWSPLRDDVGLLFVDGAAPGRHRLPTDWHPIQSKSSCHFADAGRTFGDHHKLDDEDDDEQNDSDFQSIAGNEGTEGRDDLAGAPSYLLPPSASESIESSPCSGQAG